MFSAVPAHVRVERFGVPTLRLYSVEKTIADCFKLRNRIGLHVAAAALRQAVREGRCNPNLLREFAAICRLAGLVDSYVGPLHGALRPAAP